LLPCLNPKADCWDLSNHPEQAERGREPLREEQYFQMAAGVTTMQELFPFDPKMGSSVSWLFCPIVS
jgi:hypothetical protein